MTYMMEIDGEIKTGEVTKVQLSRTTDLRIMVDGKEARFQYGNRDRHEQALRGQWTDGYLCGKTCKYCNIKLQDL